MHFRNEEMYIGMRGQNTVRTANFLLLPEISAVYLARSCKMRLSRL